MFYDHSEYQHGLKAEQLVIAFLNATASTKEDNLYNDIDYTLNNTTYSLKTQHTALKTGNLAFELSVELEDGRKEDSWYYEGKAEYYHFLVGTELYQAKKSDIQDYVTINGFDRVVGLKTSTQISQRQIGHAHVNARCGLLNATKLIKLEILVKVANIH